MKIYMVEEDNGEFYTNIQAFLYKEKAEQWLNTVFKKIQLYDYYIEEYDVI